MHRIWTCAVVIASLLVGSAATPGAASYPDVSSCLSQSLSDDRLIAACSAVIRSSQAKHTQAVALLARAGAYGRKGEYRRAIADTTQAIRRVPSAVAYYTRALAYQNVGDDEQTIRDCDRALAIEPENENALFIRGSSRQNLEDYSGAIKDFSEVLRINPSRVQAVFARGTAYYSTGQYGYAVADFTKTIDLGQTDGVVFQMRALAEAELGRLSDARSDLERASQANPACERVGRCTLRPRGG
jgi:tetratricopeptide (TPR) repeat protein